MRSKIMQKSVGTTLPIRWVILAQSCLAYIAQHSKKKGYPPTEREIQRELGLSSSDYAHRLLVAMEQAGMIKRDPGIARGIKILRKEL